MKHEISTNIVQMQGNEHQVSQALRMINDTVEVIKKEFGEQFISVNLNITTPLTEVEDA